VDILIVLPLLIPLAMGCSALLRYRATRRAAALIGTLMNLGVCGVILFVVQAEGIHVVQAGGHPAPYGISLVADPFSGVMLAITGLIGFVAVLFSQATIDANRERFAYYPLLGFLLMGVNFAFLTGDVFTLYVAFEVMLMASFVLLTLGGERAQIEGGLKYVTLNLISSTLLLIAVGLTYAVAGTLNMADLSVRLADQSSPGITTMLAVLYFIAFGIKAGMFPLFFWLPASYHTPPAAVSALFGGLLTKVGVYSMCRVLVMIFPHDLEFAQPILLLLAALTMFTGVLGAIAQTDMRRLLSFHIISQIGYLLMGLGLLTERGLAGLTFFMVHVIVAKTALFFVSGMIYELRATYNLKDLGGLQQSHPGIALLFMIAALALAGTPPLSGFWGKLILIRAALEAQQYAIAAAALGVSLLTLYSMIKIWVEAFWKPAPDQPQEETGSPTKMQRDNRPRKALLLTGSTALLVFSVVALGIFADPMLRVSENAARTLLERSAYVQAVLVADEVE
jgi:multicomponent Na+:H+ antiporter subunit D